MTNRFKVQKFKNFLGTSMWKEVDMDSCYYENGIARHRMCYVADQYHRVSISSSFSILSK